MEEQQSSSTRGEDGDESEGEDETGGEQKGGGAKKRPLCSDGSN